MAFYGAPETPEQALIRSYMERVVEQQALTCRFMKHIVEQKAEADQLRAQLAAVPVEAIQKVLEYARAYLDIVPGSAEADPHIAEVAAMIEARQP